MAAEIKVDVVPTITGLDDLIGQLRRTGEALTGLADSLQRLSDGGPDAARTCSDDCPPEAHPGPRSMSGRGYRHECPFVSSRTVHEAHTITVDTMAPGTVDTITTNFSCPGWPVRPWHSDSRTP